MTYEEERGKPMPSMNHGRVQANLIGEFLRQRQFSVYSELTLEIADINYTPDLCLYHREPADFRHDQMRRTEPPLLAVEIVSPTQGYQDFSKKVDAYFQHGVGSVWIVTPPIRNVTILLPGGEQKSFSERECATDPVLGVTADLGAVFS
ncbi:MAG: Uma2 family endonuclease [Verrucomicrobia bacterium]|nr:Uma2 family endonuclease [Verrucomicrobiota bacterium]